jgi:hypothetical protein
VSITMKNINLVNVNIIILSLHLILEFGIWYLHQ